MSRLTVSRFRGVSLSTPRRIGVTLPPLLGVLIAFVDKTFGAAVVRFKLILVVKRTSSFAASLTIAKPGIRYSFGGHCRCC